MFGRRKAPSSASATLQATPQGEDVVVRSKGVARANIEDWFSLAPSAAGAIGEALAAAEDERVGPDGRPLVVRTADALTLHPAYVAALQDVDATHLGLPGSTPLALDLKSSGGIHLDDFRIAARWVRAGGSPARASVQGALLQCEGSYRRIPEPLWSLWRAAQALAAPLERTERFKRLAELRQAWPQELDASVESDVFLRDLRVHYASAMSLKLRTLTPERTDFDPVLFGGRGVAESDAEGRALDEELDNTLTPASQKLFAETRFRGEPDGRPVYVLRDGEYVFIDPALRPVLGAVRRLQGAPEFERRAFVLNPRKVLAERIGPTADAVDLDGVFLETEQFSSRVAGVDVWRAPVLPWLTPGGKTSWLPERFGLRIGEVYAEIAAADVNPLIARMEQAQANGLSTIEAGDLLKPAQAGGEAPPDRLPVTPASLEAVRALAPYAAPTEVDPVQAELAEAPASWAGPGKLFLVVRENFEDVEFAALDAGAEQSEAGRPVSPPERLATTLKPHQLDGLAWLAGAADAGMPGVLLADDMGLGKTLQAIAFMAWLQEEAREGRRKRAPMLIVAPTGLLGAWRDEIGRHLSAPQLGRLVPAFGAGLKDLREESGLSARDIQTGRAALQAEAWHDAGVVLTTYETLRDYHFSFARTRFALVVFDEIQKLKNPASQVTRASKTLNADFTLGMTGTPVENRLQDLWSIMDVVAPGLLGASRDFERRHPTDDRTALARLKSRLMDGEGARPAWMLRRLKSEALQGLPAKRLHRLPADMPDVQANAYREVVARAAAASGAGLVGKAGILQTLAALRGVSLHPTDPCQAPADLDLYAEGSARLSCLLKLLQEIAAKGEKVLIFVENLAMQERLAALIAARFALRRPPMRISGAVPGSQRQDMVIRFQTAPAGFDVMILSPRAGGVGLTLTAANHVIHLSRWWNPAVEDQATDRVFRIGQTRDVHVYLPIAVHPDPAIRDASFDLRLDALIERKRGLTRDLFLPPEGNDGDLAELFREVSGGPQAEAFEPPKASVQIASPQIVEGEERIPEPLEQRAPAADAPGRSTAVTLDPLAQSADLSGQIHPERQSPRPTLTLARPPTGPAPRRWRALPGSPRPVEEIVALFKGRDIDRVIIHDPYALAAANTRSAQVRFLQDLAGRARAVGAVELEYAPEAEGDLDESAARRDFGERYSRTLGSGVAPRLALTRRRKRARDDDFHDRSVEIYVRGAGGAIRSHELMIGRGLEALYNQRYECNVIYLPPDA